MANTTEGRAEGAPMLREGTLRLVRRGKRPRAAAPTRGAEEDLSEAERVALAAEEETAREGDAPVVEDEERDLAEDEETRDGDDEYVELAISSESPVERSDWMTGDRYLEVLGHAQGEVDLGFARDGLPFFVGHDGRDMVGLVEDIRLDGDRVLRGLVRFSKSVRAQEIRQDIHDGIRKKISVGYDYPVETYDQTEAEGRTMRRYRGWRPLEVSSVPIPADYEVGVGRNARPGARRPDITPGTAVQAKEHPVSHPNGTPAPAAGGARVGLSADHAELAATARLHNLAERLPEWIGQGATMEQVREEIIAHYKAKSESTVRSGTGAGPLSLTTGERQRYSFARAVQSQLSGAPSFETEISDELYKATGRKRSHPNAVMVSTQMLAERELQKRNMAVANTAAGQSLRFDEPAGFLEILRNRMFVAKAGAMLLSGVQGDLSFVTNPSSNGFQWGAETANATATFMGTGIKSMTPKNGAGRTNYTRQLLAQSYYAIDAIVENDLMKVIALALDRAAIVSGGGSAPVGVLGTTGIGSVTMGTAGAAITSIDAWVDLEAEVAIDNADIGALAYMTTPRQRGRARKTQEFSGTNGVPIWTGGFEGEVNGYRAYATNQVPANLTKGSNTGVLHAAIFGNWSDLIIAEWGAVELIVDPYSNKPNFIEVAAHVLADVMVRYPESFASVQDALQ